MGAETDKRKSCALWCQPHSVIGLHRGVTGSSRSFGYERAEVVMRAALVCLRWVRNFVDIVAAATACFVIPVKGNRHPPSVCLGGASDRWLGVGLGLLAGHR